MTDKERLEEIKERVLKNRAHYKNIHTDESYWGYSYELSDKDYEYLIEQAERVQELEQIIENQGKIIDRKEQQNKRYREGLEFYADPKVYFPQGDDYCSYITMDYGGKARLALEEQ